MGETKSGESYVKRQLTAALLALMAEKEFADITVSELVRRAGVARASFYRNFADLEDILVQRLETLVAAGWSSLQSLEGPELTEALFTYFNSQRDLLALLYRAHLSRLLMANINFACGPQPDQSNGEAYYRAFIAHGLFGWVDEWIKRGMRESPAQMADLQKNGGLAPSQNAKPSS